jgi:hypothetical protein
MGDFLKFKKLITPTIIQIVFWVLVVSCVFGGVLQILRGIENFTARGDSSFLITGFAVILGGPLAARVYCEILIVAFSINDTLMEIRDNTRRNSGPN